MESLSEYPIPSASRYTSHIKEYGTEIVISDPPPGVRTGMTAKVTIKSEQIDRALQIPLTSIFRIEGRLFAWWVMNLTKCNFVQLSLVLTI